MLKLIRTWYSGFAFTTTPGKAGEALRSVFLKKYDVGYRVSLGALIAERTSDLIAVVFLSALGLWMHASAQPIVFGIGLMLFLVLFIIQKRSWLNTFSRFAQRKLPERFSHIVEFFVQMISTFRNCFEWRMLWMGILLGILAWGAEGLAFFYLLYLLDVDVSLLASLFIYSFSLLIGALSFLPGGLGSAEVTMWQLLLFYGVSSPITVAVTVVIRLTTLWFSVLLGVCSLPRR